MRSANFWSRRVSWSWLIAMFAITIFAAALSGYEPNQVAGAPLSPANNANPLGTDGLGRDFLTRMLFGARASLGLSAVAAAITVTLGAAIGFSASMLAGRFDRIAMWLSNVLLAIPGLLLAMLLVAALGPGLPAVVLAVGIGGAPGYARLVRSVVTQLLREGYVAAALAAGGGKLWITVRHLLPNALPQLRSLAGTYFAWAFLGTTTLTFLGFAGDPALSEWGAMLNSSRSYLLVAPRLAAVPAAAISLTLLAVHTIAGRKAFPGA